MEIKKDVWDIEGTITTVRWRVAFERPVTLEQAKFAVQEGRYEEIIDEEMIGEFLPH